MAYDWTIDGETVDGTETMTHTFEAAGEFTVEVTVENEAGKTEFSSSDLLVLEQDATPTTNGTTDTTTEPTTPASGATTEAETPGFGFALGLIALLGAALLAGRRLTWD